MDIDPRLRPGNEDNKKNLSFSSKDAFSKPEHHLTSHTQGSLPSISLPDHGLRNSRAAGEYYGHISPDSSNDQLHDSTPSSTGNVIAEGPLGGYLNEMSLGIHSDDRDPNDPLADLKRPRACEACRQLKVRCEPDNDDSSAPCKRCAKAKRKCVVTAPTRKRQKKTDSRVSELEKKIDALTATLQAGKRADVVAISPENDRPHDYDTAAPRRWLGGGPGAPASTTGTKRTFHGDPKISLPPGEVSQSGPFTGHAGSSGSPSGMRETPTLPTWQSHAVNPSQGESNGSEIIDVIDRGLIDFQTATDIFNHYVNEVSPILPIVVFPPGTTMSDVRHNKPILFHAIITLSIPMFRPDLQLSLVQEVHRIFADRVVVKGEKSLELVQSIMLACTWYTPPDQFEELKFFQFIHMAIAMALDIGMGRVTNKKGNKQGGLLREIMGKNQNRLLVDPDSPETRRIWLGAYFMAVNASMALRRPLLCRWHRYMDECIEILQTSPDALPSDKVLVHWAKLSHIAEEIGFQFSMDDPSSSLSMSDTKAQYGLKGFEKQLDEWRQEVPAEHYSPILRHLESILNIYMHEISMHSDHNIDDFRPPFSGGIKWDLKLEKATAAQVDALTACLTSIHNSMECMLSMKPADMICLPTVFYARTAYAFIALLKMFSAITSDNGLSRVFSPADLKVEEYFEKMIDHLKLCSARKGGRTAGKFSMVLNLLRNWFNNRKTEESVKVGERTPASKRSSVEAANTKSETVDNPVQHQVMPSSAASTNQQIPTPTSAAPNVQQWSPYDGSTSEAAGSNNFFTQQYQFGQDSAQTTGNPTMAGMMPTTTTQTEYGGLMPEFEFPMLFDTTALFSMGEMLPDELFSLPIDGNGNFYAP